MPSIGVILLVLLLLLFLSLLLLLLLMLMPSRLLLHVNASSVIGIIAGKIVGESVSVVGTVMLLLHLQHSIKCRHRRLAAVYPLLHRTIFLPLSSQLVLVLFLIIDVSIFLIVLVVFSLFVLAVVVVVVVDFVIVVLLSLSWSTDLRPCCFRSCFDRPSVPTYKCDGRLIHRRSRELR